MDALANILGVSQDRCVLSVQIFDDILARWGGLRPLIDVCFAFDGNWPANPFGKNAATAVLRGDHRCMQSELLSVGFSPQWVERFYKAINSVWLYQEAVNFCNIMHWECASALYVLFYSDMLMIPQATIRDNVDVIKVWNILFFRLFLPLFQLGRPSILGR